MTCIAQIFSGDANDPSPPEQSLGVGVRGEHDPVAHQKALCKDKMNAGTQIPHPSAPVSCKAPTEKATASSSINQASDEAH